MSTPAEAPRPDAQPNYPLNPADIYAPDQLALALLGNVEGVNLHMLEALQAALAVEKARRTGVQVAATSHAAVEATVNAAAEHNESEVTNYYELIVDFMNRDTKMSFERQFAANKAFWDVRGIKMPDPSYSPQELKGVQKILADNPQYRLIATPLPLDPEQRIGLFVPIGAVDQAPSSDQDFDTEGAGVNYDHDDDEAFFAPHRTQPNGAPLNPDFTQGGDFNVAHQAGSYVRQNYEERQNWRGKPEFVPVGEPVEMRVAYSTHDAQGKPTPIMGRQQYLSYLKANYAGTVDVKNGEEYWTFQIVDPARPVVEPQRTPYSFFEKGDISPLASPELAMTMALLRNDAGVFDPHASVRDTHVEPVLVTNEMLLGTDEHNVAHITYLGVVSDFESHEVALRTVAHTQQPLDDGLGAVRAWPVQKAKPQQTA